MRRPAVSAPWSSRLPARNSTSVRGGAFRWRWPPRRPESATTRPNASCSRAWLAGLGSACQAAMAPATSRRPNRPVLPWPAFEIDLEAVIIGSLAGGLTARIGRNGETAGRDSRAPRVRRGLCRKGVNSRRLTYPFGEPRRPCAHVNGPEVPWPSHAARPPSPNTQTGSKPARSAPRERMPHLETILLATDGSPASEPASGQAIDLATQVEARLLVVSVLSAASRPSEASPDPAVADSRDSLTAKAQSIVQRAKAAGANAAFLVWEGEAGRGHRRRRGRGGRGSHHRGFARPEWRQPLPDRQCLGLRRSPRPLPGHGRPR